MDDAKGIKRTKDAQRNKMGQGSPRLHENYPSRSIGQRELSKGKIHRRPNKHELSDNMAEVMEQRGRSINQPTN